MSYKRVYFCGCWLFILININHKDLVDSTAQIFYRFIDFCLVLSIPEGMVWRYPSITIALFMSHFMSKSLLPAFRLLFLMHTYLGLYLLENFIIKNIIFISSNTCL